MIPPMYMHSRKMVTLIPVADGLMHMFYCMGIKPGPKRIAISTGKPDRRQRDNKQTPGNTPSLKPHRHKKGD